MTKQQLEAYARMFMTMVGQRITDDEITIFLDALGPTLKERIRKVLNTIDVKPTR